MLSKKYYYQLIGAEISSMTRYYDQLIQMGPLAQDSGELLAAVDAPSKQVVKEGELPVLKGETDRRTAILLNANLNYSYDIEGLLQSIKTRMSRTSRVVAVLYNPYLRAIFQLATWLKLRKGSLPTTFVTRDSLSNLARLSGFEIVRSRPVAYVPFKLFGLGTLINRLMPTLPLLRWLAFAHVTVLRPVIAAESARRPKLSVVIPARNERGNIENALKRMPDLGCEIEIIFVEGHSSDGTWEEIQRVVPLYAGKYAIKAFQQTGKGKGDAVRLGFAHSTGELMTILDADLTMPPELLGRFYEAYCSGLADFVNGSRLVYPMEGEAMRPLNFLGNVFFAKSLATVLDSSLSDSLCGTKLVTRHDYERMKAWRRDFGDFDPFGDFELLFPASVLGLGMVDIPIRYRSRTYGATNIHRFRHGLMLFRMTWVGLLKIRAGQGV